MYDLTRPKRTDSGGRKQAFEASENDENKNANKAN